MTEQNCTVEIPPHVSFNVVWRVGDIFRSPSLKDVTLVGRLLPTHGSAQRQVTAELCYDNILIRRNLPTSIFKVQIPKIF